MTDEGTVLADIKQTVQDIRSILILTRKNELEKIKATLLPEGSIKARIYELCDSSNTTKMIAQTIGRDEAYVRANISVLRREGLVRSVDRNKDQFHEQIF
jgi:DNA-binding MarR family transcriptional regulator